MRVAKPVRRKPVPKGASNHKGHTLTRESIRQQLEAYKRILDSIYNGVMVTDADGYITHFNKPYGEFLGVDYGAQIGKHCTEVV